MTDRRRIPPRTDTAALSATQAGEGEAASKPRIDYLTRLLVVRLHQSDPDASLRGIAAQLDVSESSVRRILAAYAETKDGIRDLMRTDALDALEDWTIARKIAAAKGYHQPTKDWLEAAQVIEPKPTGPAVSVNPTVILNMPFALGALQPAPTTIEAHAVPVLPAKEDA